MINVANMLNLPTGPSGTTAAAHHASAGEAGGTLADAADAADPSGASFAKVMKKAQADKPQAADAGALDDTAVSPNIDPGSALPALVLAPLQIAPPAQALVFAGLANQRQVLDEGSADSVADGMADSGQTSTLSPTHSAIDAGQARRRSLPLSATAGMSGPRTALADAAAAGAPVAGRAGSDKPTTPRSTDPVQPDTDPSSPQRLTPQTLAPIVPHNAAPVDPALDKHLDPLQGDPANTVAQAAGGAIPLRASVQPGLLAFGNGPAQNPVPVDVDNTVPDPKPAAAAVPVPVSGPAPTIWPLAPERNSNRPVPRQAADALEPGTRRTAAGTRSLAPAVTATTPSPWQTAVTAAASAAARDAAATNAGDSTSARAAPAKLGAQDPALTALTLPGMNAGGSMSLSGPPGTIAQASIRAPVGSEAFATQTGYQVAVFARAGVERAELQLNPADMGPVTVQIVMEGTTAMVHLSAHHADTRSALETAMPQLASSLRDAGLTLTGGGVFEQPRQPQPQDGGAGDNNKPGGRGAQPGPDSASTHPLGGATATSWLRPRGVVDLVA